MRRSKQLALIALTVCMWQNSITVQAEISENDRLKLYGDFRTRLETDFDSQRADGTPREDRSRIRIRARIGMTFQSEGLFSLGARIRSGSDDNHQSPHITVLDFDDNDTGDADFNFDKWFLKAENERTWAWAGRSDVPLWKQNEFLWSDDVTVTGLAAGYRGKAGKQGSLTLNAGYFSLPVGMKAFSGNLLLGQVVFATELSDTGLTVAGGLLSIDANPGDPDAVLLLRDNGFRDYTILTASVQAVFKAPTRPLTLGLDFYHNTENYDQTDGYALSAKYGDIGETGHWQLGWTYASIEARAVHSSYSQDNWVRWGSSAETRATDLEGHELQFAYALASNLNAVARIYLAESITSIEDGKRFRIDFNYNF
jgi:hypothetical protein